MTEPMFKDWLPERVARIVALIRAGRELAAQRAILRTMRVWRRRA